jgi:hypothetical protein
LGTGGCPRVPAGRVGGSSGSTIAHHSSLTRACLQRLRFCKLGV